MRRLAFLVSNAYFYETEGALMRQTGKRWIPAIIILITLFVQSVSASEIVLYSLPQQKSNSSLDQKLTWKTPLREWISLNGEWQTMDPKSDRPIGKLNVPFALSSPTPIQIERRFSLPESSNRILYFNAEWINGWSRVSINGRPLFDGTRNFLPLRFEIPPSYLSEGENIIRIELTPDQEYRHRVPHWTPINLPNISMGILASIHIEIIPDLHIQEVEVNPSLADSLYRPKGVIRLSKPVGALPSARISIQYQSSEGMLFESKVEITDSTFTEIALPGWQSDPIIPWSTDHPVRYWIEARLDSADKPVDLYRQEVSLRSVNIKNSGVSINDQPVAVQGINYVYQTPDGNQLFDPELIQQDLRWIKENGFNAVRVILHPLPEQFYQICDELGLLCFQDLPLVFSGADSASLAAYKAYSVYSRQLAERFSSLIASGVAYQIDGTSERQLNSLQQFLANEQPSSPLPYVTSLRPVLGLPDPIAFQIVEVINRNEADEDLDRIRGLCGDNLYFPSAFSKPISYRVDSTTVTHDLMQLKFLYQQVDQELREGEIQGHFALTYSDYYLNYPSLQNGLHENLRLCQGGVVDLKRQPRPLLQSVIHGTGAIDTVDAALVSEARSARSYLYIILGIFNLFLFLYFYRRFTEFRHNVNYAMKKPHGFFVDLQERIMIPHGQSLLLVFGMSLNGAIIWSSITYYFRNNLILDYLLSLIFFDPDAKRLISELIWNQPMFLLIGMLLIVCLFFGMALITKLLSLFGESRVTMRQSVAVSAWAAAPFLLLLPFGIVFYNLLLSMKSYWIIAIGLLYFHVWVYLRWINGTRVLTEKSYYKVLILFTVVGLLAAFIIIIFYQYQLNLGEHLRFLYHLAFDI